MAKKDKLLTCQLCGKTDKDVDIWVGGYFSTAHHECAEIGHNTVGLYLLHLHHSMFSLREFAEDVLRVIKREEAEKPE